MNTLNCNLKRIILWIGIVAHLTHPIEILQIRHSLLHQKRDNISTIDPLHNQGTFANARILILIPSDTFNDFHNKSLIVILKRGQILFHDLSLRILTEHNRAFIQHQLHGDPVPDIFQNIVGVLQRGFGHVGQGLHHPLLHFLDPQLDFPSVLGRIGMHGRAQVDTLARDTLERHNIDGFLGLGIGGQGKLEFQLMNGLKNLGQVFLHLQGVFGLGQNFQQLVFTDEEEAREDQTLGVQVFRQAFLDFFQKLVGTHEIRVHFFAFDGLPNRVFPVELFHVELEGLVHAFKFPRFKRHFDPNVIGLENGKQVFPKFLAPAAIFQGFLQGQQPVLKVGGLLEDRGDVGRTFHENERGNTVVQRLDNVVDADHQVGLLVFLRFDAQVLDLVQDLEVLFLEIVLLFHFEGKVNDVLLLLQQVDAFQVPQGDVLDVLDFGFLQHAEEFVPERALAAHDFDGQVANDPLFVDESL